MTPLKNSSPLALYIGTYTSPGSYGVFRSALDPVTGALSITGQADAGPNPSFLALSPNGCILFAVNELSEFEGQPGGAVSALKIDPSTGTLSLLNRQPSHGTDPCHLAVDRTGRWLFVANYGDGVLSVYPVMADGSLGPASDVIQHQGSGPDPERQQGPHAHAVYPSPDNRFVLACDLGLDKILVYRFDPEKGKLSLHHKAASLPGAGPRHLDFHPNGRFVYLINEMSATLTAFRYEAEAGQLREIQSLSILPEEYAGFKSGAEVAVHPSGRFVYTSSRGESNCLAIFAIDENTGRLTSLGCRSTLGRTPRGFTIDPGGQFLLVANQDGGSVICFRNDPETGELLYLSQIELPNPVCVLFPV